MELEGQTNWAPRLSRGQVPPWLLLGSIAAVCLGLSVALAAAPLLVGAALVVGVAVFIVCFISAEASLYLLIFSMLLSPEIGMGGLSGEATTTSRGVTIRTEDLLLVVMCFAWLVRTAVHKELGLVRRTPLNRPIASYAVACIFATGMGLTTGRVEGMTGLFFVLKYIEYFVVYFVVSNNLQTRAQVQRFTAALLVTAAIVALVALAQIPTGARVSAPFEGDRGEPNTLGGYLLFVGSVAAGLLLNAPQRRTRRLLAGLIAFLAIPFFATLSRGSYLGLPFAYLSLVALTRRRRLAMLAVLLILVALGAAAMPQVVRDRILYTFEQQGSLQARVQVGNVRLDTSTSARLTSWQKALEDVADSPVWGFGVTGYGFLDAQYPRILVETGLIGAITFALLVGAVGREGLRVYRHTADPLYRGLSMGLLAGLAGLLVHGVGANTFIIVRIMEPFWLTVGLVVGAGKIESETTPERPVG
ncbi:MAG: O-antigen ligase family protein [Gemmatimonadota bacterium]